MTKKKLNESKIKIRSSEVIRIVATFNSENLLPDDKESKSKYSYIRDLILLKIGKAYNKYYNCLCDGKEERDRGVFILETVEIESDGTVKVLTSVRYKRLLCGSSFVRNTKELYIKEELYDSVMEVLLTGIEKDTLFPISKVAKYSTYLGLAATDSTPVSMPNICVVKDFKKKVKDAFDIVKQIKMADNKFDYAVINFEDTGMETEEEINCFDGAGIVSYERAKIWAHELGVDYVPSSFQIRVLNGIKGNLYTFPITEYIQYVKENSLRDDLIIDDLWGDKVDIEGQEIDIFLTESQFKFHSLYKNFEAWKKAFLTPIAYNSKEYTRTFNISAVSLDIVKLADEVWSAYQPLQTLDFSDEDLHQLAQPTIKKAEQIYGDIKEFLKYRGLATEADIQESINEYLNDKSEMTPWYYKALLLDYSLQYDPYIRRKINNDLQNMTRRFYMGKIILDGNYQTAMPDLLGLVEHIFNLPVIGALGKGEIYSNYWNIKSVDKVSIWRNPHIAREWFNAKVIRNEKTERWFKYQTTGIVTDIYSTLALRCGTMDFDGDTLATVHSDIIYNAVETADIHTIRVMEEDHTNNKKCDSEEIFRINDFEKIMYTNKLGFQNNIGDVTNKVTVLWGAYGDVDKNDNAAVKEIKDDIKIMSVINQLIIDFVKTGIKVPIPDNIKSLIEKSKKPEFMQNRKGQCANDKKITSNVEKYQYAWSDDADKTILETAEQQKKYKLTNGTVDRLYKYLQTKISEIETNFLEAEGKCHFTKVLNEIPYTYNQTYPRIKNRLLQLMKIHNSICGVKYYEEKEGGYSIDQQRRFARFYSFCECQLLSVCGDRNKLLNYVIYAFYAEAELYELDKSILWNVFGKDIFLRYVNDELCTDDSTKKKLQKKEKRTENKIKKMVELCADASIVSIKNMDDNIIEIHDSEIEDISNMLPNNISAQNLFIVLLALHKKINRKSKRVKAIKIVKGKKNEITENQICKLANIYYRQFADGIKTLYERKMIELDISNLKVPQIMILYTPNNESEGKYVIENINDVRKKIIEKRCVS